MQALDATPTYLLSVSFRSAGLFFHRDSAHGHQGQGRTADARAFLVGLHHQSLLGRWSRHCHGINYTDNLGFVIVGVIADYID